MVDEKTADGNAEGEHVGRDNHDRHVKTYAIKVCH